MPATLEEVCADARPTNQAPDEGDASVTVPDDSIPLESMTWPELKRVARRLDLKLNMKKPELIRRIRETRDRQARDAAQRETLRGRIDSARLRAHERCREGREAVVRWWRGESEPGSRDDPAAGANPLSKWMKVGLWCGGIAMGGVVALIVALI